MKPGPPALCSGTVWHRRLMPRPHGFRYDVSYVWFDPDHPESITDLHWAWSTGRLRPAQIRADDYGSNGLSSASAMVRRMAADAVLHTDVGEIRLLTQPRRWGWLFNPISVYLAWPSGPDAATGPNMAVLEVTNTPWKERHHYAVELRSRQSADGTGATTFDATFPKALHVSPFLGPDLTYHLEVSDVASASDVGCEPRTAVSISVTNQAGDIVLETGMNLVRRPVTRESLTATLRRDGLPTHRVSRGIHHQAARLMAKGIAFVPHPQRSARHGSTRH